MSNTPPTESALLQVRKAVRVYLAGHAGRVLVACSGGADSLALAAAVAIEAPRLGVLAGGVVVDHQLFAGSLAHSNGVAATLRRLGLDPVEVSVVEVVNSGEGIEAAARVARYEALARAAASFGADMVLLGHTRDDQAETVLMRLSRGSGARSLAGMAGRRDLFGRPLLDVSREVVRAACTEAELEPWEDPANADPQFLRSRVRHELMPVLTDVLGPGAVMGLARSADLLRDDAEALDDLANEVWQSQPSPMAIEVAALLTVPRAVRTRVIRLAALAAGVPTGELTFDHVRTVERFVSSWRGQGPAALPGGVTAERVYGRLEFSRSQ